MEIQIGDFVHAYLVGGSNGESRQGVFVEDNGAGRIKVEGETETYICHLEGAVTVQDSNLWGSARDHVQTVRRRLGLTS